MSSDLVSTLGLLIAFNGLAFGTILAVLAVRGRAINPAIPGMTFCLSALMILNLLHDTQGNTRLTELRFAVPLLIGPTFLLFVIRDCGHPLPRPRWLILHAAPAALMALAVATRSTPDRLLPLIILTHIGAYIAYAALTAARNGAGRWSRLLSALGAAAVALNIISLAAERWSAGLGALSEGVLFAVLLAMVCALIVAGLSGPAKLIREAVDRLHDVERTRLDDAEVGRLITRIESLIAEERPHLDPGFRLSDLAHRLREPERRVSQAINQAFDLNVPDFLNRQRVMAVQSRLADQTEVANLLEIAFDCGFNSKATFNRAFARHTGSTPSQARAGGPERTIEASQNAF
ncbi:MAG TPA: helix-turn-helix domain-containing protein [Caulobacter sp.]|nr:helix-turn-helix domain-containing protein [Caulobacter sp.]